MTREHGGQPIPRTRFTGRAAGPVTGDAGDGPGAQRRAELTKRFFAPVRLAVFADYASPLSDFTALTAQGFARAMPRIAADAPDSDARAVLLEATRERAHADAARHNDPGRTCTFPSLRELYSPHSRIAGLLGAVDGLEERKRHAFFCDVICQLDRRRSAALLCAHENSRFKIGNVRLRVWRAWADLEAAGVPVEELKGFFGLSSGGIHGW